MKNLHNIFIIGKYIKKLLEKSPLFFSFLVIYNYHFNEVSNSNFNHIFRSPDEEIHEIDPKLINLLDKIQSHFKADIIELISGYRSPLYNKQIKSLGKNVADESLHMQGKAADIHIDEVSEKAVWEYVKSLKTSGAGCYPGYNFVHVDTGRVRSWMEDTSERKIISETTPIYITDKNEYFKRNFKQIVFKPNLPKVFKLERFSKGKWFQKTLKSLPYGKYRVVTKAGQSNEFYIRKK